MSSLVLMLRNTLTKRYITFDGSAVASTSTQNTGDNFILHDIGTIRIMRTFNNQSIQIQRIPQNNCQQNIAISSTGSAIFTSPPGTNSAVNVFIKDDVSGEKWYFKVDLITRVVSLECQSALDNASSARRKEFEFDLLNVSTANLN